MLKFNPNPCLVSPEWTAAASGRLVELQPSSTTFSQLLEESVLLEQLVYKNSNQHRGTRPFQKLLEVRRLLRLAREADIDGAITDFKDVLSTAAKPTITLHERSVPSISDAITMLKRILGFCRLAESIAEATIKTAAQFTTQLAQSFFMPLSLTCLALLARIRAIDAQLLLDCVKNYNALIELMELLPVDEISTTAEVRKLPQMLKCNWKEGKPFFEEIGWQASDLEDLLFSSGVGSIKPTTVTTAGKVEKNELKLAVLEDRGVAISRDELMAELRRGAEKVVVPLAMALPEYEREEKRLVVEDIKEKKRKKGKTPKIKIVDEEKEEEKEPAMKEDEEEKMEIDEEDPEEKIEDLPSRKSTAFISVEGLQEKKKKKIKKQALSEESAAAAEKKSWEDWLAPLGGSSAIEKKDSASEGALASIQSDLDLLSSNFFGSSLSRPSSTSNGGSSIDKFTALAGEFGNGGGTVDYAAVYNAPGFDREGFDKALNEVVQRSQSTLSNIDQKWFT